MRDEETGSLPDDPRQWFHSFTVPDIDSWPPEWSVRSKKIAYRDLVGLVERARDLVAKARLGPDEVAAMLIEARAPMPAADNLSRLAADCLTLALFHVHLDELFGLWSSLQRRWRELNAAVETFRQGLPEVIKELGGWEDRIAPMRRALKQLNKLDLTMPGPRAPARRPWAEGAASLAKTYRETVDPDAGWFRNGPAVRFLELALNRIYPGHKITRAAIEKECQVTVSRHSK